MKKIFLFISIIMIFVLCGCTYPYKNVKRVGSIKVGKLDGRKCVFYWNKKNESNVNITSDLNVEIILGYVFYNPDWLEEDGTSKPDLIINDFTISNTVRKIEDGNFTNVTIRNLYYDGTIEEYNAFLQWTGIKCAKKAMNKYILDSEGKYEHNNKKYNKL